MEPTRGEAKDRRDGETLRHEAARNRHASARWARIYDSFVWTWIVGPLAYVAAAVALSVWVWHDSWARGIRFGVIMLVLVIWLQARTRREEARQRAAHPGRT